MFFCGCCSHMRNYWVWTPRFVAMQPILSIGLNFVTCEQSLTVWPSNGDLTCWGSCRCGRPSDIRDTRMASHQYGSWQKKKQYCQQSILKRQLLETWVIFVNGPTHSDAILTESPMICIKHTWRIAGSISLPWRFFYDIWYWRPQITETQYRVVTLTSGG